MNEATRANLLPTLKEKYGPKVVDQTNRRAPQMGGVTIKNAVLRARGQNQRFQRRRP